MYMYDTVRTNVTSYCVEIIFTLFKVKNVKENITINEFYCI